MASCCQLEGAQTPDSPSALWSLWVTTSLNQARVCVTVMDPWHTVTRRCTDVSDVKVKGIQRSYCIFLSYYGQDYNKHIINKIQASK